MQKKILTPALVRKMKVQLQAVLWFLVPILRLTKVLVQRIPVNLLPLKQVLAEVPILAQEMMLVQ